LNYCIKVCIYFVNRCGKYSRKVRIEKIARFFSSILRKNSLAIVWKTFLHNFSRGKFTKLEGMSSFHPHSHQDPIKSVREPRQLETSSCYHSKEKCGERKMLLNYLDYVLTQLTSFYCRFQLKVFEKSFWVNYQFELGHIHCLIIRKYGYDLEIYSGNYNLWSMIGHRAMQNGP
jgi:hypothetical protein